MRYVNPREYNWFFNDQDNFQGLRTGSDFCTEHELGIRLTLDAFAVDTDAESMERFRNQRLPEGLVCMEHKNTFAIMYHPGKDVAFLKQSIEHNAQRLKEGKPAIFWDNAGFMLMSPLSNQRCTQALKRLWEAFHQHDVYLGGPFSHKYRGGGMGFFIASQMPKEEIEAASIEIAEKAERARQIEKGAQRDNFYKVRDKLSKQGKKWFALSPHGLFDDGSVMYWLNPQHQKRDYFGAVSIQDLKDWAKDTGKIPGGAKP